MVFYIPNLGQEYCSQMRLIVSNELVLRFCCSFVNTRKKYSGLSVFHKIAFGDLIFV